MSNNHYVIMDPRDNSVTLSPELFAYLGGFEECHRAYAFKLSSSSNEFGFITNPDFAEETQIAEVQVNTKTKEIGFECLIPSVVTMFARNCFDLEKPRKVPVNELYTLFDQGRMFEFDFDNSVVCY